MKGVSLIEVEHMAETLDMDVIDSIEKKYL